MDRSRSGTRRCRCWSSASTLLPASIVEVMPTVLDHFAVPAPPLRAHADEGMKSGRELAKLMAVRGIRDEKVLAALAAVPRELFVPEQLRRNAYADRALPIGSGQTISQPFMVATMLEALRLDGGRVLEVGTGSGYQAALLAELADEVVTIERFPSSRRRRGGRSSAPGTSASRFGSATARSASPSARRSTGSRRRRGAGRPGAALRPARARRPPRRAGRNAAGPVARDRRARAGRADPRPDRAVPLRSAARCRRVRRRRRRVDRPSCGVDCICVVAGSRADAGIRLGEVENVLLDADEPRILGLEVHLRRRRAQIPAFLDRPPQPARNRDRQHLHAARRARARVLPRRTAARSRARPSLRMHGSRPTAPSWSRSRPSVS